MWFLYLLLPIVLKSQVPEMSPTTDDPWDVDGPCQIYVEKFARAQSEMVRCATNWSIPPKVCTNCFSEYIDFKQVEWETKNLDNVFSLDNRTCSQVIYDNYLLSYSSDISQSLTVNIWEKSRCDSCLTINWDFKNNKSDVAFSDRTLQFQNRLYDWRNCVVNSTGFEFGNNTEICSQCKPTFDSLFKYYWKIYITPNMDFCVDVETTMNDTIHLWNDVWKCSERQDRNRDVVSVLITMGVLLVLTALFYAATYIQGGGQVRNLVRYSRMDRPRGQRSRLLTSGYSESNLLSPTTSVYTVPIRSRS